MDDTTRKSIPGEVNLGRLDKIPLGQGFCFIVGGEEVAVFRQRDGNVFATQNRCPHKNGPLSDGVIGSGKVICPLHAKKFDLSTGEGPEAHQCLKTYPIEIVNGEIYLLLQKRTPDDSCAPAA
jgi:nitrite reductase (NADH) small subunit